MDFYCLPRHHFIYYLPLLGSRAAQVDACCLDALMPHQVGKQGNVIELIKEVLGKAMTERMWIDHFTIQPIQIGRASCRERV